MLSLHPRQRRVPTRPAQPGRLVQVEHESERAGATPLVAAGATRSGQASGVTPRRKRRVASRTLLEHLAQALPAAATPLHLRADHVAVQHGKLVR
jgi:hypothetical protein